MDEPTGGLDPLMQNEFFDILSEEKSRGTTIFFSSHVLSEVQRICDRVAIIKEGEIVAVENIEDLVRNKVKNITLTFKEPIDFELQTEGIVEQEAHGNIVKFLYKGDIKALLIELTTFEIEDIVINEPSLEEIFLHYYYEDEGEGLV
jgi:ABC-2 type transport system ATP-binding protein